VIVLNFFGINVELTRMLFDSFISVGFLLGAVLVPCRNFLLGTIWSVLLLFV
jgi:hypothetical protein